MEQCVDEALATCFAVIPFYDTGSLRDARETSRLKQSPVGATNNGRIAMVPRLITASFVSSLKGRLHLQGDPRGIFAKTGGTGPIVRQHCAAAGAVQAYWQVMGERLHAVGGAGSAPGDGTSAPRPRCNSGARRWAAAAVIDVIPACTEIPPDSVAYCLPAVSPTPRPRGTA
jgi:hypothetical protein